MQAVVNKLFIEIVNKITHNKDNKTNRRVSIMAQTNINIRMDEDLKRDFDRLCTKLGLNMTTAFNIFARTVVHKHGIPFEVALDIPNSDTIAAIEEVQLMKRDPKKSFMLAFQNCFYQLLMVR